MVGPWWYLHENDLHVCWVLKDPTPETTCIAIPGRPMTWWFRSAVMLQLKRTKLLSVRKAIKLRDSLLSQHLVPSTWSNHIHTQNFVVLRTWWRVPLSMSSVIMKLSRLKKGLSQDVEDNADNIQSQDKHWGRLGMTEPETSQVQYRALAIGLWRIISAMQHTSEHNTCSVEIWLKLCCYAACA